METNTNDVNMPTTDDMNGPVTMAPTDYVGPTNCQGFWNQTFADMGSMGHYPRPQGNLPMFSWGLTQDTQKELGFFYKQAFSGFK